MKKSNKKEQQTGKQKSWVQRHLATLIIVIVLIGGLGLLIYPNFADWWNSFHQSRAIASYMDDVAAMDEEQYQAIIDSARAYNQRISDTGLRWVMSDEEKAAYQAELDFTNTGIMGYIQIDKINIMLPVYHGISEAILQTSIGHIEGTSLPVGCSSFNRNTGELDDPNQSNHIVLSGHRGLPSAKLFSDLDRLVEGDTFTLTVLNETYTYEVDQIRIVLPEDLSDITLEKGKDYCTLVTCTPYGINTHRLLVRGHRVGNVNGDENVIADALLIDRIYVAPFIAIPIITVLLIILLVETGKKRKRSRILRKTQEGLGNLGDTDKKQ